MDDGGTASGGVDLDPTPNTITINVNSIGLNSVAGRFLFYNQSKYDSNTAGVDDADDGAIATDKVPYFAGGGVIGPRVDVRLCLWHQRHHGGHRRRGQRYTASDFIFKIGTAQQRSVHLGHRAGAEHRRGAAGQGESAIRIASRSSGATSPLPTSTCR